MEDMPTNLGKIGHDEMKYRGTPQACVTRMISTACNDGRLLCFHFTVLPSLLPETSTSTQPACTQERRPLNSIAVLMTTALGR